MEFKLYGDIRLYGRGKIMRWANEVKPMRVTVAGLLKLLSLRKYRVVAGEGELSRFVSSISVVVMPFGEFIWFISGERIGWSV